MANCRGGEISSSSGAISIFPHLFGTGKRRLDGDNFSPLSTCVLCQSFPSEGLFETPNKNNNKTIPLLLLLLLLLFSFVIYSRFHFYCAVRMWDGRLVCSDGGIFIAFRLLPLLLSLFLPFFFFFFAIANF